VAGLGWDKRGHDEKKGNVAARNQAAWPAIATDINDGNR